MEETVFINFPDSLSVNVNMLLLLLCG